MLIFLPVTECCGSRRTLLEVVEFFFSSSFLFFTTSSYQPCISVPPLLCHTCCSSPNWPIRAQYLHTKCQHYWPVESPWQPPCNILTFLPEEESRQSGLFTGDHCCEMTINCSFCGWFDTKKNIREKFLKLNNISLSLRNVQYWYFLSLSYSYSPIWSRYLISKPTKQHTNHLCK